MPICEFEFWDLISTHWRTVGKGWDLDKETKTVRAIAREWFDEIKRFELTEAQVSDIFMEFRSKYSTKDPLTSKKNFMSLVYELRRNIPEIVEPESEPSEQEQLISSLLSSFVSRYWLRASVKLPDSIRFNWEAHNTIMLQEAYRWAVENKQPQERIEALMKRMKEKGIQIPSL